MFSITSAVPVLSDLNVERIVEALEGTTPSLLVEYGSGASTVFFINKLKARKKLKMVSVENSEASFN